MTSAEIRASALLGAIFVVFGLNGFFRFLPTSLLELTSDGNAFVDLLTASGYFYVVKSLEVVAGLLILSRRYMPLGLALIAPVVANIFLFHLFLDQKNLTVGLVLVALWGFMAWRLRARFMPLLQPVGEHLGVEVRSPDPTVSM